MFLCIIISVLIFKMQVLLRICERCQLWSRACFLSNHRFYETFLSIIFLSSKIQFVISERQVLLLYLIISINLKHSALLFQFFHFLFLFLIRECLQHINFLTLLWKRYFISYENKNTKLFFFHCVQPSYCFLLWRQGDGFFLLLWAFIIFFY